jgi:nucleotide-binding universal stress UspA family protein
MKTILVPVDFSPVSRRVLQEARKLAQLSRARIVLIHILKHPIFATEYSALLARDAIGMLTYPPEVIAASERAARAHLTKCCHELRKDGLAADQRIYEGIPGDEIVREAKKLQPEYIVIGSHGHNAFYNFVVGTTAGAVLKAAPCPVIIVTSLPPLKRKTRRAGLK